VAAAACAALPAWASATFTVAPGQSLARAVQQAADGDVIELLPGEHRGQVAVLVQRRLTVRGAPAASRPVLLADGQSAEGKAILVVRGGSVQIENLEFRGARVPDHNGAGIRFERGRLWVRNCAFFDNQNGILAGNVDDAELTVENSVFGQAPPHTMLPHLVYVGRIARFVLQGSHLSGGLNGHLVKSRARVNEVRYNHLVDGADGRASYELEFPNGGAATVVGNVIAQGEHSSNPAIVSFGAEGEGAADEPGALRVHSLVLVNNTLVNSGWRPAQFVRVHEDRLRSPVTQRWVNNLFVGLGVADVVWGDLARGNFPALAVALRNPARGDFTLNEGSLLRGRGLAPQDLHGGPDRALAALWPSAEFSPPLGSRPLPELKRWSPGAHP
jgi:hypothetical protein